MATSIQRGPNVIVVGSVVEIEVLDVADPAIMALVKRSVREAVGHLAGKWRVHLVRSGNFGQWDLRLTGAFGRHVAQFRSTPEDLPDGVARRLRAFLHGIVPPLGTVRHPVAARRLHLGASACQRRRPRLRLVRPLRNAC